MQIDPHRLMVLRAVARAGGVLPASRALHLSASGVSQHLAKLEAEVGVELVDRSRRGGGRSLALTAAGRALARHAEQLASTLTAAEREMDRFSQPRSGAVRIGGFASVLTGLVAPVVMALSIAEPGIEPLVHEVDEDDAVARLRDGQLDLVVAERATPERPTRIRGVREVVLVRDPYLVALPAGWPPGDDPRNLLRGPWVGLARSNASRQNLERLCGEHDLELDVRHECRDSTTMLALVAAGLGAALVPQLTWSHQVRTNVRIDTRLLDPGARVLTVLHTPAGLTSGSTAHVLQALTAHAAGLDDEPGGRGA